ncbi:MAG TPA: HRDC domain-containing protein, partial [Sphingobacteriaceae bacterium]
DEISMVRADLLDGIDEVLRRFKNRSKPFGGIQLLMIGDLHQLSPVVKDDDWRILKDYYPNLYFFSSKALQQTSPLSIELTHIYRQSDQQFIDLLNSVRENKIDDKVLRQLNQRHLENFHPDEDEGYITLTTHNQTAQEINESRLKELKGKVSKFTAVIQDDFPEYSYPTERELEIKPGAQVMFAKNDPSRDRLYFNGKIGKVVKIQNEVIYVKCPQDLAEIAVEPVEWTNIKFELNPDTKEVEEKIIGTFTQYPLKLAWAITIHKSQGLTFEKAIIDANAAFAHGQVYVALSRCKSFEGLVLRSPLASKSVRTDGTVAEYTKNASDNSPGEQHLLESKITFQKNLLFELFDFGGIKTALYYCNKVAEDHITALMPETSGQVKNIQNLAEKEIYTIAQSFTRQIASLCGNQILPEENEALQERIRKACQYFLDKTEKTITENAVNISLESDNKGVKQSIAEAFETLRKEVYLKTASLKLCLNGFNTLSYLKGKADADIDYKSAAKPVKESSSGVPLNVPHPKLYAQLKAWRDELAEEKGSPVFMILPQKALLDIMKLLPATLQELAAIKGIGKVKVRQFGKDILEIVNDYSRENNLDRHATIFETQDVKAKPDTKKLSLDLYKEGKKVQEIATLRGLTSGTIEGHLAHYITTGDISIFDLVPKIKVARIMAHLVQNPDKATSELKAALGEDISYGDLRAVKNHLDFVNAEVN